MTDSCNWTSITGECTFDWLRLSADHDFTIPVVVFVIVVLVLLFFAYATIWLAYCHFSFTSKFKRLVAALKREKSSPSGLGRAALNRVGESLAGDSLCEHGWREFTETIVSEGSGEDERIFNTRQAEEFFSEDEIVEESMHPSFFRSVPGVLTSLGLFGTFVAILFGLAAIHVPEGDSAQAAGQIEGISPFVNALSGKFLSSVMALSLAILFTLMETHVLHRAHQTYRRFCQSFDAVFPRRTAEEVLMQMRTEISQQRAAFEHFNTDLSARFRDGVTEGLGPVLERIVTGLDSITGDRDSNIEALLERLTTEFRSAMTQSAGAEFEQVAATMDNAAMLIQQANDQTATTQNSFQGLVDAMERSQTAQRQVAEQQSSAMNASIEKMVETLARSASESTAATDGALRDMVERSSRESQERSNEMQGALSRYMEQMSQQVDTLCQRVDGAARSMEAAGVSGSQGLSESIERVTRDLERTAASVVQQTGTNSDRMIGELSRVLQEHRESIAAITEVRAALQQTLDSWLNGTEAMKTVVSPLTEAASTLRSVTRDLNGVSAEVTQAQRGVSEILSSVQVELRRIVEMEETSERILGEHRRVFDTVQSGLAGTLTTLTQKLSEIQAVTGRGLSGQLKEFDNHLSSATQKLSAAIDELGEVLDGAADTIADAAAPKS